MREIRKWYELCDECGNEEASASSEPVVAKPWLSCNCNGYGYCECHGSYQPYPTEEAIECTAVRRVKVYRHPEIPS